jgi:hypothetical protein
MNIAYTYGHALPVRWETPRIRGPGTHVLACHRIPVRKLMAYDANGNLDRNSPNNLLPLKFVERLEQDQKLAHCCRHPENHDIVAWYTCEAEEEQGTPDLYILHCTCGRQHRRLMCTLSERPYWESR